MKKVNREEFYKFIQNFSNIEKQVDRICEPIVVKFYSDGRLIAKIIDEIDSGLEFYVEMKDSP